MTYVGKKPADIIATAVDTTTGTFSGDLTVDTNTLYVDSANNRVGIGTSSPAEALVVKGDGKRLTVESDDYEVAMIGRAGSSGTALDRGYIRLRKDGVTADGIQLNTNGDSWMNGGNVGIGTSSPSFKVDIQGTDSQSILIKRTDASVVGGLQLQDFSTGGLIRTVGAKYLRFDTDSTERMRIDSSGNLLVGTTAESTWASTAGHVIRPNSSITSTRDGGQPLIVNRLTSDGTIIDLRKDGTTVGNIGVEGGNSLYIHSGDTGLRFSDSANKILPVTTAGSARDNAIALGSSGARFTDLYLSGGAYIGGTGSANHLDDYEEGTWTPVVSDATSGGNTGSYSSGGSAGNRYIKVGRLVFVTMELFNINTSGMTSGNTLVVQGLPFSGHSSGTYSIGTTHAPRITVSGYESAVGFMDQNPYVRFFCYDLDGSAAASIEVGNVTSGQGDLLMTLMYFSA